MVVKVKKGKVLFCSSAGGHYTELLQLSHLIKKYNGVIVTEKTTISKESSFPTEYLMYCSKNDGWIYIFEYLYVWLVSLAYFIKYNPKVVVSTGAHSTIPMCVYARLFWKKVIYIETVANVHTPSVSGKLMYKLATDFYVQWEELLEVYPKAIVGGCLF